MALGAVVAPKQRSHHAKIQLRPGMAPKQRSHHAKIQLRPGMAPKQKSHHAKIQLRPQHRLGGSLPLLLGLTRLLAKSLACPNAHPYVQARPANPPVSPPPRTKHVSPILAWSFKGPEGPLANNTPCKNPTGFLTRHAKIQLGFIGPGEAPLIKLQARP